MSVNDKQNSPLYHVIKNELVAMIGRGEYEPDRPFVTQREVCERYSVSSTTAVRALNDLVAEGYLVRRRGKGTFVATSRPVAPAQRRRTIACLIHGIGPGLGPHLSAMVDGVEAVCAESGFQMILSNTQNNAASEEAALRRAIEEGVAGVVLYPVEGHPDIPALADLRAGGIPLVTVDRYRQDIVTDAVIADNFDVGYRLTESLIALGHERVALLWSETDCSSVRDRLSGHTQALRRHGIPVSPELTVLRPYLQLPEQQRLTMLKGLVTGNDPATALLCANGYVLAAAAHDLAVLGVESPGQVELAGMDDAGPFDLLPLTVVAAVLPSRQMGEEAMRLLAQRMGKGGGDSAPRQIVLPIELRSRASATAYLRVVSTRDAG